LEGCDALIRLVPRLGHFLTHPALPRRYAACPQPAEPRRSCCTTASTGSYDAPSKLACCAPWKGTHVAPTAPLDGLPSLLLVLYATRLIGLLLRASTSTAQSVTISFTMRARWASTRGQQPSSFLFPRAHSGAPERCAYPSSPILRARWASKRSYDAPSKLARSLPLVGVGVTVCDLRGCIALWLRSLQAMARRTVRRSVRTKSGTERVAEPSSERACVSPSLKQRLPHHPLHPFQIMLSK
jgi:hypothetical protein